MKRRQFLCCVTGVASVLPVRISPGLTGTPSSIQESRSTTSTEWRNDEANLDVVRELNRAYERIPFSHEYEGVLDYCPLKLEWSTGPNLPLAWKGGVAGIFDEEIALVGGKWGPAAKNLNLAYAYSIKTQSHVEIPPPPFKPNYTQGTGDGKHLYLVGGRTGGRNVAMLSRSRSGSWTWTTLPSLPDSDAKGRWFGKVGVIPGKWLFLVSGLPAGRWVEPISMGDEGEKDQALPDWRLRLDKPNGQWEPMSPYPGGLRACVSLAVVRGKVYVFGGNYPDKTMTSINERLVNKYGLMVVPYQGNPDCRDAYCFDPDTNEWRRIHSLPFPMSSDSPGIVLQDRYVLLMGNPQITQTNTRSRVGKTNRAVMADWGYRSKAVQGGEPDVEPWWRGYGDVILCYDLEKDNYSRVGAMLYGVGSVPWVTDGKNVYGFGGEPTHYWNENAENVLQIGAIQPRD